MERHGRRFAFKLALALGRVNVDAMLREITSEQFAEWLAYFEICPLAAEEVRHVAMAATVANFSPKFTKSDWQPSDFIPKPIETAKSLGQKILATFKHLGNQRGKTK